MKRALKRYLPSGVVGLVRGVKRRFEVPQHRIREDVAAEVRAEFQRRTAGMGAGPKIVYALIPTADWPNIGDHAQVVAVQRWITKHYPELPVLEVTKDEAICATDLIAKLTTPRDLILLHSGGNLGDRAIWSETARRSMIRNFPNNTIVSLPQTISFSNTPTGQVQRRETMRIYSQHRHLTVVSRDEVSASIAEELFPGIRRTAMPDFVLSMDPADFGVDLTAPTNGKILACLRNDDESNLSSGDRSRLLAQLGPDVTVFDTHLHGRLEAPDRERVIRETLQLFAAHDAVVTDRFHGTIFAVLCRKPIVVLSSIDHKLDSGLRWFSEIANITLADKSAQITERLAAMTAVKAVRYPDFNALYFDRLPEFVREGEMVREGGGK